MKAFHSGREAKEFLISRIVVEAQRENVLLSEVERKMLYFTESGWTLPDMTAVSEEFDRDYDQNKYEKKIARLIRNAAKHDRKESRDEYDAWWTAIRRLQTEDHYLVVMIRQAGLRPSGDLLRLWGTGVVIVLLFLALIVLSIKYGIEPGRYLPSRGTMSLYVWAALFIVTILYQLFRLLLGAKRVDDWVFGVVEKVVRFRAGRRN
jgi:hypothetical protein